MPESVSKIAWRWSPGSLKEAESILATAKPKARTNMRVNAIASYCEAEVFADILNEILSSIGESMISWMYTAFD